MYDLDRGLCSRAASDFLFNFLTYRLSRDNSKLNFTAEHKYFSYEP